MVLPPPLAPMKATFSSGAMRKEISSSRVGPLQETADRQVAAGKVMLPGSITPVTDWLHHPDPPVAPYARSLTDVTAALGQNR